MTISLLLVREVTKTKGRGGQCQKPARIRAQNSHLREVGARLARDSREAVADWVASLT